MSRVEINTPAADFELVDHTGTRTIRLRDYRHRQHVLVVFNRGFL